MRYLASNIKLSLFNMETDPRHTETSKIDIYVNAQNLVVKNESNKATALEWFENLKSCCQRKYSL